MQEGGIAKVQNALTLLLTLKVPPGQTSRKETYNLVKQTFDTPELQQSLIDGLNNVGTVHFARFFFLDKQADKAGNVWYNKMALITSYDGELRRYIKDFVRAIAPLFDALFQFMEGTESMKDDQGRVDVKGHPKEFLQFAKDYQVPLVPTDAKGKGILYSAYPDLTVKNIRSLASK